MIAAGLEMYYDQIVDERMQWGTSAPQLDESIEVVGELINKVQEHIYDARS